MEDLRLLAKAGAPEPQGPPSDNGRGSIHPDSRSPTAADVGANAEGHANAALFGIIPSLDSLVASLRTCEVAAEATRAVGERFLTDACAQGLMQISAQAGPAAQAANGDSRGFNATDSETTISHIGVRAAHLANMGERTAEGASSLRDNLTQLAESSIQRSRREVRGSPTIHGQRAMYTSADLNVILASLGPRRRRPVDTMVGAAAPATCKRRKGNEAASTGSGTRVLTSASASLPIERPLTLRRTASAATPGDSLMGPPAGQRVPKKSRMSRRLEWFRREAEEALRGQQNVTVMTIFSTMDGHIRNLRGGSMSPSELDQRIMTVLDKCLPLEGVEAKAVEAVLDMNTVRKLKASMEERPRNGGALLDLIALSKLCRHIPGVCFDKWNLGWIATWREHRRPVHKHFSAKKYGFFRAREFAICYRSKMTSDPTLEGEDPPTSPRSMIAQGDLSPLLMLSTDMFNEIMLQQQIEDGESPVAAGNSETRALEAIAAATAGSRPSRHRTRPNRASASAGIEDVDSRSGSMYGWEDTRSPALHRGGAAATAAAAAARREASPGATTGSEPHVDSARTEQDSDGHVAGDVFTSRDGWADLVARTPRVERVSFDFTNQSWIAQWKQNGRTTYRRFAVSKYGFSTAHKLAVEYKTNFFRETPSPFAPFVGSNSSSSKNTPPAADGGSPKQAEAAHGNQHPQKQASAAAKGGRPTRERRPARRQRELNMGGGNGNLAAQRETDWLQAEMQGNAATHLAKHHQRQREGDRSAVDLPSTSSGMRRKNPQALEEQQWQLPDNISRGSDASAERIGGARAAQIAVGDQCGAASPVAGTTGTSGGLAGLEALLCSPLEIGEMNGCPATIETVASSRALEGVTTTATPTSHTHISVDFFPTNTLASSLQQQTPSTETGTPHSDAADDGQAQGVQRQELQRTLLRLINGQAPHDELPQQLQQQTQHLEQQGHTSVPAGPQSNQGEASTPVEMLRTAVKCMLLDISANCLQDVDSAEGRRQVYQDLVDYHLKFVDETQHLDALRQYSQLFATCLTEKKLPSALSAATRMEFLHSMDSLFMQQQQQNQHQERLMHSLVMQAQQQRQIQQQRAAADQQKLALVRALMLQNQLLEQAALQNQTATVTSVRDATRRQLQQRNAAGEGLLRELSQAGSIEPEVVASGGAGLSRHQPDASA